MLQASHSLRQFAVVAVMLAAAGCASAQVNSFAKFGRLVNDSSDNILWYTSPLPLGVEAFMLHPLNRQFYLPACLEDRRFDRLEVSRVRTSPFVIDATGQVWQYYPDELRFRVTASAIEDVFKNLDTSEITEPGDMNSFSFA